MGDANTFADFAGGEFEQGGLPPAGAPSSANPPAGAGAPTAAPPAGTPITAPPAADPAHTALPPMGYFAPFTSPYMPRPHLANALPPGSGPGGAHALTAPPTGSTAPAHLQYQTYVSSQPPGQHAPLPPGISST
jgi:hypothetical protein